MIYEKMKAGSKKRKRAVQIFDREPPENKNSRRPVGRTAKLAQR